MSAHKVVGVVADDGVYRRTVAGQRAAVFGVDSMSPEAMRWLLMLTGFTPVRAIAEIDSRLATGREQVATLLAAGLVEPVPADLITHHGPRIWSLR